MAESVRDAVTGYVSVILTCVVIARRRNEALAIGEDIGEVEPIGVYWPPSYRDWMSGRLPLGRVEISDVIVMTCVPGPVISAIFAQVEHLTVEQIRTERVVTACEIAALHAMVGPIGSVRL